nr:hypothetical protein [uncultured Mediterranean phage uvMED]
MRAREPLAQEYGCIMSKQIYITDNNFIYVGQKNADLDPMASKREGKDVYTGSFPYASFDKPPEYEQDEYAILIAEKWEIRKCLAGVYYHIQTLERLDITDPYNGDLSDYTKIEPPQHQQGDTVTFKDGDWAITLCDKSIAALRLVVFAKVKAEVNRRVRTIKGRELSQNEWLLKSQNYQDIKGTFLAESLAGQVLGDKRVTQAQYDHAVERINRKDRYVAHYHTVLKPMINAFTVEQLQDFDATNDELWKDLDAT